MENPIVVYDRLVSKGTKLNIKKLLLYIELIRQIMGEGWFNSEAIKAKKGKLKPENIHRLIYLLGCYNTWVEKIKKTHIANPRKDSFYGKLYVLFQKNYKVSKGLLDSVYNKHEKELNYFYTKNEISNFKNKWKRRSI